MLSQKPHPIIVYNYMYHPGELGGGGGGGGEGGGRGWVVKKGTSH